ncbi:hypothetical protein [Paraburkholderia humisilvae]|uniref:hypothetical protein n=1 Tax=Paraburkholderia humisilvae TaxID=627669 RepID=UPI0015842C53|nr:hypothetical protein [Paraburkholderia humisilvae]
MTLVTVPSALLLDQFDLGKVVSRNAPDMVFAADQFVHDPGQVQRKSMPAFTEHALLATIHDQMTLGDLFVDVAARRTRVRSPAKLNRR